MLSGRRSRAAALSDRADVFHPDPERGVDDLAARSHGAPHLSDRPTVEDPSAVQVWGVDRQDDLRKMIDQIDAAHHVIADRKSTPLNSSHTSISDVVFCM